MFHRYSGITIPVEVMHIIMNFLPNNQAKIKASETCKVFYQDVLSPFYWRLLTQQRLTQKVACDIFFGFPLLATLLLLQQNLKNICCWLMNHSKEISLSIHISPDTINTIRKYISNNKNNTNTPLYKLARSFFEFYPKIYIDGTHTNQNYAENNYVPNYPQDSVEIFNQLKKIRKTNILACDYWVGSSVKKPKNHLRRQIGQRFI